MTDVAQWVKARVGHAPSVPRAVEARDLSEPVGTSLLDHAALLELIEYAPEGIAVLDQDNRYLDLNPAGCRLLDSELAGLRGTVSPWSERDQFAGSDPPSGVSGSERVVRLGRREFSYNGTDVWVESLYRRVVMFRDVSKIRQRERQLHAFAKTAASLTFAEDLSSWLDRLAEQVRQTTEMYSCTFLLYDEDGQLQQSGTAGDYPRVPDYGLRMRQCGELGAPLAADKAITERTTIVAKGWRKQTLEDSRFAPIHDFTRNAIWDTLVVVPIQVRGRIVGVFNGFYLPDHEPGEEALRFLNTIAEQAAVAIDNATLLAAAERQATLEERHRLARDLHDSVSQLLFSLALNTRALELSAGPETAANDGLRKGLREIEQLTQDALAEMRALIFQLRPAALHEEGLVSAIRKHASVLAARESLEIIVYEPTRDLHIDPATEVQLFRVIQEALNNVVKHVVGGKATISFQPGGVDDGDLVIEIADNGPGFDLSMPELGHYGLQTMTERVEALGGQLRVASDAGGTTIRALIPKALRLASNPAPATHQRESPL